MMLLPDFVVASARAIAGAAALILPLLLPIPPAVAAEAVRPAFEATSELFELVGRIRDGRLTLTLDRWASNEPVADARIEIDVNGRRLVAAAESDGSYAVDAAAFAAPATYPLTITITAGNESDLLAADFVVASAAATPAATDGTVSPYRFGLGIAAALTLLAAVVAILRRRKGENA